VKQRFRRNRGVRDVIALRFQPLTLPDVGRFAAILPPPAVASLNRDQPLQPSVDRGLDRILFVFNSCFSVDGDYDRGYAGKQYTRSSGVHRVPSFRRAWKIGHLAGPQSARLNMECRHSSFPSNAKPIFFSANIPAQ